MAETRVAERRYRRVVSLVALVGVSWIVDGRAAGGGLTLHWEAPPGCPGALDVRAGVERLSGGTAHVNPSIDARAVVARLANGQWRVQLETIKAGARGTRTLEADSCQALADSVSLILAVMVQPAASLSPPSAADAEPAVARPPSPRAAPPSPARAAPTKPPASPVTPRAAEPTRPSAPTAPAPRPPPAQPPPPLPANAAPVIIGRETPAPRPTPPVLAVGVAAIGAAGVLPDFAWGGGLTGAWLRNRWRFQATGEYLASQSHAVDGHPSVMGEYSGLLGAVDACLQPGTRRVSGGVCLGVEGGGLHAASSGVRSPGSTRALWVATEVAAVVELVPTSRWALRFELAGAASLRRPDFAIGGIGDVHEPSRLTARGKIVAEMLF